MDFKEFVDVGVNFLRNNSDYTNGYKGYQTVFITDGMPTFSQRVLAYNKDKTVVEARWASCFGSTKHSRTITAIAVPLTTLHPNTTNITGELKGILEEYVELYHNFLLTAPIYQPLLVGSVLHTVHNSKWLFIPVDDTKRWILGQFCMATRTPRDSWSWLERWGWLVKLGMDPWKAFVMSPAVSKNGSGNSVLVRPAGHNISGTMDLIPSVPYSSFMRCYKGRSPNGVQMSIGAFGSPDGNNSNLYWSLLSYLPSDGGFIGKALTRIFKEKFSAKEEPKAVGVVPMLKSAFGSVSTAREKKPADSAVPEPPKKATPILLREEDTVPFLTEVYHTLTGADRSSF